MNMNVTNNQISTGPSRPSLESSQAEKKPVVDKIGSLLGKTVKLLTGILFRRITSIQKKNLDKPTDTQSSLKETRAVPLTNAHIKKLYALRVKSQIRNANKFIMMSSRERQEMLQTLAHRKPGDGIYAEIERHRKEVPPKTPEEAKMQKKRKKELERAVPVNRALHKAHDILDTKKNLEVHREAAKRDPELMSEKEFEELEQKIKELQPLSNKVQMALRSPRYRNLFERLFLP